MGEPIRVAHVVGKMVGGGVEQVVMNYYRHIDRDRVQFDFLVDADSTLVPRDEIESLGGRIFELPPYQSVCKYRIELFSLFSRCSWPIVHSHINTLSVFPLGVAKKAKIPIRIAHSHATMGKGETKRNIIKTILRLFSNCYPTDRVACSTHAGEWLFGKEKPFTVIPNAIEIDKFRLNPFARGNLRRSWGIEPDCCVIGTVGRMERTKNHSFLIDVFSQFHCAHPNSKLVIAGSGSLRSSLEAKVRAMNIDDSVLFMGQIKETNRIYQGMDVFLLPSLYEGFGMALLEAQVSGLPCIASDRVPIETVLSDGCELMPLEKGASIWAQEIWSQLNAKKRYPIPSEAIEYFDIDKAAKRLVKFYYGLI